MQKPGKVSLVGAGPGDWRLLTLGAKAALEEAEVVIYDRLASKQIMGFVPEDAECIYVGKASNQHTLKQDEINDLIVKKALEGKRVVRLKGGDPFVFGRGGEEAIFCREHGVPFDIYPGVTSAIAAPAYGGIPVTHRHVAASFTVVTGHEDPDKEGSSHRWEHLAQGADTLIFLMGVENLPHIQQQLLKWGKDPKTPAAFIRWGTRPNQETWTTTLGEALELRDKEKIKAPAIFIVGPVVELREELAWFDKQPLFGKRILVTRARQQASQLSVLLEKAGAEVFETPMIQMNSPTSWQIVDRAIDYLSEYSWIVFTSPNGVEHFIKRLYHQKKDTRSFGEAQIAAVGSSTARALLKNGLQADLIAEEFRAESLLGALKERISSGDAVLLVRPEEARNILPDGLEKMGVQVTIAPVYQTVMVPDQEEVVKELLEEDKIDWVTFSSASTVQNLLDVLGESGKKWLEKVNIAAIGPITAEEVIKAGLQVDVISSTHTIPAMVEALIEREGEKENA